MFFRPRPYVSQGGINKLLRRVLSECPERRNKCGLHFVHWNALGTGQLTEFGAVRVNGDRNMLIGRRVQAQALLHPDLTWCRVHQINAAYDFCHALQMIIDSNSEMVRDQAIASKNDEITRLGLELLRLGSLQTVSKFDRPVVCTNSHSRFKRARAIAAISGLDRAQRTSRHLGEVASGATALVGEALGEQLLQQLSVLRI